MRLLRRTALLTVLLWPAGRATGQTPSQAATPPQAAVAPQAAAQALMLLDKGSYTLVDDGRSSIQEIPIWLASIKGIATVEVSTREIRNPDGALLPVAAVGIADPAKLQISTHGAAISLHIRKPELFVLAGDYPLKLLATLEGATSQTLAVILHRDAAALDTERLADLVLPVTLRVFGDDPKPRFNLPLSNPGKTAVRDLRIVIQPLRLKAKKELLPGSQGTRQDGLTVPARDQLDVSVELPPPQRSGSFQTSIELLSPSLGSVGHIPLTIEVSHHFFWAMLVIFIGVFTGFLVNYFTKKWRPTQQLRMQLLQVRSELQRFESLVEEPGNQQLCAAIRELLQQAELMLGDPAAAKELRRQASQKLDDLRKSWSAQLDAASTRHRELTERLGVLRGQRHQLGEGAKELAGAEQELTELASLLLQRRADAVQARLRQVEELFARLAPAPAAVAPKGPKLALDGEDQPVAESGRRAPRFSLRAPEPPERCEAHAELLFVVEDSRPDGQKPTAYEWSFGTPSAKGTSTIAEKRYTFQEAGEYWVTVTIRFADGAQEISRKVTIHPNRAQQKLAEVGWRLARADLLMSGLSLLIATGSGFLQLYLSGPFGAPEQYFSAFLWGIGIDSSVRGAAAVLQRLTGES